MKGIYIFLAEGYEPLEALAPMDILRRAKLDVKFVSLSSSKLVPSTQGYAIEADLCWQEFLSSVQTEGTGASDCMIFPGGLPGAQTLGENAVLMDLLRAHWADGGLVGAICAAPAKVVAANLKGCLDGKRMTVYEGWEKDLEAAGASPTGTGVCLDGQLVTAKGPGLAVDFGLALLARIVDPRIYDVVKHAMML